MTFIELLTVVVLVGVLSAAASATLVNTPSKIRVAGAASELLGGLRFARAVASASGGSGLAGEVWVDFRAYHSYVIRDLTRDDPTTPSNLGTGAGVEGDWIFVRPPLGGYHGIGLYAPPPGYGIPPLTTEKAHFLNYRVLPMGEAFEFRDSTGALAPRYATGVTVDANDADRVIFRAQGVRLPHWQLNGRGYDTIWVRHTDTRYPPNPEIVNPPYPPPPPAPPTLADVGRIRIDPATGRAWLIP